MGKKERFTTPPSTLGILKFYEQEESKIEISPILLIALLVIFIVIMYLPS